ncbi:lipocalin family protein [Hyunsoonleella ulvae]|uniref:lipocalin family protein n=1 Tax=Hyunsoonleella ulvae TaxID=2799948 RepID=UPI0019393E25|nr:lipocalin family protein [Hyunsoonleella ulvae]
MKTTKFFSVLLILLFTVSCSESSNEDMQDKQVSFEGVWQLRDIDFSNASIPAEVSGDIVDFVQLILNEGCEMMVFEFRPDKSVILEQYDVNDFNPTEEEVEYVVNCENIDTFIGTWDLQENQLTISGEDDESSSFSIRLQSSIMILEDVPLGAILPVDGQGDFVFEKLGNG